MIAVVLVVLGFVGNEPKVESYQMKDMDACRTAAEGWLKAEPKVPGQQAVCITLRSEDDENT